MGAIYDAMCAFFEEDEWAVMEGRIENTLMPQYQGQNGRWSCIAFAAEEQKQFAFYSIVPVNATEEMTSYVAEFVHRINYGLLIGNFEFDFNDGEIRFKTSIDVEGSELTFELARNTVYANVLQFDQYLPAIYGILHGGLSMEDALAKAGR
ncbi:MAG: YbjN domain-containing protein [Deltaproteobacteria bacterium]|nr:MAG: YbjN domain-containing protein [Deltaproteobacteria bacterium]